MVLQHRHAPLLGEFYGCLVLGGSEASALGVEQKPGGIGIGEDHLELFGDDGLVLVEVSIEEDELGQPPAPADDGHVADCLLGIGLAVAQHAQLFADHPAVEPIDLVFMVHDQKDVFLAGMLLEVLLVHVDSHLAAGIPIGHEDKF